MIHLAHPRSSPGGPVLVESSPVTHRRSGRCVITALSARDPTPIHHEPVAVERGRESSPPPWLPAFFTPSCAWSSAVGSRARLRRRRSSHCLGCRAVSALRHSRSCLLAATRRAEDASEHRHGKRRVAELVARRDNTDQRAASDERATRVSRQMLCSPPGREPAQAFSRLLLAKRVRAASVICRQVPRCRDPGLGPAVTVRAGCPTAHRREDPHRGEG